MFIYLYVCNRKWRRRTQKLDRFTVPIVGGREGAKEPGASVYPSKEEVLWSHQEGCNMFNQMVADQIWKQKPEILFNHK